MASCKESSCCSQLRELKQTALRLNDLHGVNIGTVASILILESSLLHVPTSSTRSRPLVSRLDDGSGSPGYLPNKVMREEKESTGRSLYHVR